jgi:lipopolysaccharide/colanic/teichoic acid biosynthesis glycosyltransferase
MSTAPREVAGRPAAAPGAGPGHQGGGRLASVADVPLRSDPVDRTRSGRAVRRALRHERRSQRPLRSVQFADAVALLAIMSSVNLARFGTDWPTYPLSHYAVGFSVATAIHLSVYYFSGLYEPQQRLGAQPWLPRVARATLVAVLLDAVVALATGRYLMPRGNLVALLVVATLGITAIRRVDQALAARREGPPRVLLVGPPDKAELARAHLPDSDRTAVVVGQTPSAVGLPERAEQAGATEVLLLTSSLLDDVYPVALAELESRGVRVLQRVSGAQTLLGLESVREVGGMPFVALSTHTLPLSRARLKRYLELLLLLFSAPLTVPLTVLVACYVRAVAGRHVLFRQDRVGRDGVVFSMVKFRTMRPPAAGAAPALTERDDPRVVPGCRILRATRLDELPQLWHVATGQMSLVGPRPERPELTALFEQLIAGYSRRYEIPPGITGMAQVRGRYATDPEYKLGHDLQYLVNWSPARDLQILVQTMFVVLARKV